MLRLTALPGPFGVDVDGIGSAEHLCDVATVAELAGALARHRILRIAVSPLSDAEFARFGSGWGTPIEFFRARDRHEEHPQLIRITNAPTTPERLRDGAMHWHQDSTYESPPASVTMLHALEAPGGNDTRFVDMIAAHDSLDPALRHEIRGLVVRHDPNGGHPDLVFDGEYRGRPSQRSAVPEVTHPLVIRHPGSGASALYGVSGTAVGIVGKRDDEALSLLRSLKEHALSGRFEQRARAEVGTILIWDNLAVMHCATPTVYSDRDGERRLIHRISLRCEAPLVAAAH
jgi:taurine dioxygenase